MAEIYHPMCLLRLVASDVLVNNARLWAPELFLKVLIEEMLEANPGVTEATLRMGLRLNPDGSINTWILYNCNLRVLPELFGAVRTTDTLGLYGNQLSSLPESFGSITVGGNLYLYDNQLDDQTISANFPNVDGKMH